MGNVVTGIVLDNGNVHNFKSIYIEAEPDGRINLLGYIDEQGFVYGNDVTRILQSGNRTIVFWADGTKTIVKCADDEPDDPYNAFTAALAIKTYGNNSKVKRIIDEKLEVQYKDRTSGKMYIMENHETRKARRKYDKKKRKEQSHE